MTLRTVTIWHNVQMTPDGHPSGMLYGYTPGDMMSPVFTYPREGKDTMSLAEDAFELFNAPPEALGKVEQAIERRYRALRLRSLSTGDLVSVNGYFWSCQSAGWGKLGFMSPNVAMNPEPPAWGKRYPLSSY